MNTKRGFTLVELLTVIVIIGILVTLVAVAVAGAMRATKRGKIGWEMNQIAIALDRYKAEFGEYPPDMFDSKALERHVKKRWPRLDWTKMPAGDEPADQIRAALTHAYLTAYGSPVSFNTAESLIGSLPLWLGGFPNQDGILSGFYADPENPFIPPDNNDPPVFDKKVFMHLELEKNVRIVRRGTVPVLVLGNEIQGVFVPFVYFKGRADGGSEAYTFIPYDSNSPSIKEFELNYDSANLGVCVPYAEEDNGSNNIKWKNPTTFQLIHPGLDGKFGKRAPDLPPDSLEPPLRVIKTGKNIGSQNLDDITNFSDYKELKSILP